MQTNLVCPKKLSLGRQGDITKTLPLEQLWEHDLQIVVVVLPPQTVLLRICIVGHASHLGLVSHCVHRDFRLRLRRRWRWGRQGPRGRQLHQQLWFLHLLAGCLVVPLDADLAVLQEREQRSARGPAKLTSCTYQDGDFVVGVVQLNFTPSLAQFCLHV